MLLSDPHQCFLSQGKLDQPKFKDIDRYHTYWGGYPKRGSEFSKYNVHLIILTFTGISVGFVASWPLRCIPFCPPELPQTIANRTSLSILLLYFTR